MGCKALLGTLDKKLKETDHDTHGDTLGDVETFAVFDSLADTLAEGEANRVNNTLVDKKVQALIEKNAVTLFEAQLKTLRNK